METKTDYNQQAIDFAETTGTKLNIISKSYKPHFAEDKPESINRNVYKCKLIRNRKTYTFDFGASLNSLSKPGIYEVLAAISKYDPGTFEDFCKDFGYNEDSRNAEYTYKAVCAEWKAVKRLFGDVLEGLREIN